jgi:hypothetical protein
MTEQEKGLPTGKALGAIEKTIDSAFNKVSVNDDRYREVVSSVSAVENIEEALVNLQNREFFVLMDASASMCQRDPSPEDCKIWSRWDSAKTALKGILSVLLSLDKDNQITAHSSQSEGVTHKAEVHNENEVDTFFKTVKPNGGTPMANALNSIYEEKIEPVIDKKETATCIVFTDGSPNSKASVFAFFDRIQNKYGDKLSDKMLTFQFIRIGDDPQAIQFLKTLDDDCDEENLNKPKRFKWDIIDTKSDNYIFATDPKIPTGQQGVLQAIWESVMG